MLVKSDVEETGRQMDMTIDGEQNFFPRVWFGRSNSDLFRHCGTMERIPMEPANNDDAKSAK